MKQYASIEYFINESRNGRNNTTEMCSCVFKSSYSSELSYEVQLFGVLILITSLIQTRIIEDHILNILTKSEKQLRFYSKPRGMLLPK